MFELIIKLITIPLVINSFSKFQLAIELLINYYNILFELILLFSLMKRFYMNLHQLTFNDISTLLATPLKPRKNENSYNFYVM
jgi:hypothetical protein